MNSMSLNVRLRNEFGSGEAGRMRRAGRLPAVIYGKEKANRSLSVDAHEVHMLLQGHSSEHLMLELLVEGEGSCHALLQDVQHHPVSGKILHLDFHEISMTDHVRVEIPVHLTGESVGVKQHGGLLEHLARVVEVECLPGDIVESFMLDVSSLDIGDAMVVTDLKLDPEKYTLLTDADVVLASVHAPRVTEEAEEGEEGGKSPEVIGEKAKKEEAEEA